ncbi:MAG: tetratricopeptide repeat protein [Candidatus Omnitrophica bacterium]|nr:tetratricopeptide repeat protein [Candidatus Omnitrophota bacterium]
MNISPRLKSLLLILLVLLMVGIAYAPSLNNGFTYWDEENYLLNNIDVRSLSFDGVKRILSSTVFATYSPLPILSFACEYHFFGYNPFVYHSINLLLHMGVVVLVFLLGLRLGLGRFASVLTALIFGIHPMHVESVAWIVERKDMLYAVFYLASVCSYLKYIDEGKRRWYWWAIAWCALSMLSKAMALSLPLILLLCQWVKGIKINKRFWLDKIPFFLVIVPIAAITYSLNARIPGGDIVSSALVWIWTFVFYIQKFLFPFELLPLYQLPQPVLFTNFEYLISFFGFGLILALLFIFQNKKWFLFAFLFYFFSIFFCLRFDSKVDVSIVADRFMYLPSLGFCLFFGKLIAQRAMVLKRQRSLWLISLGALIVIGGVWLTAKTFRQCDVWQNAVSLWTYVIQRSPGQARAYDNLGAEYLRTGDYDAALVYLEQAVVLDANHYETYNNIGLVYLAKKDFKKAIDNLDSALRLNPDYAIAYNNLGVAFQNSGELARAETAFKKALQLDGKMLEARLNLAGIEVAENHQDAAERLYFENLELDPAHAQTRFHLVKLYLDSNQKDKAYIYGDQMIRDGVDVVVMMRLGELFLFYNDAKMTQRCYQRALKMDRRYKPAYLELGKLMGNYGSLQEAVTIWQQGLRFYPKDEELLSLIQHANELMF